MTGEVFNDTLFMTFIATYIIARIVHSFVFCNKVRMEAAQAQAQAQAQTQTQAGLWAAPWPCVAPYPYCLS
jgi:hypothetical protein